ncbi:cytochrome b/b6 domain-containing protein [Palleronia rufa]|uniref:cytochrome b/b6 domain-containing protein n=1 Tax=Palleronia rufa TaxID=1530186 RepID=UPI00068FEC6A|nr:cytochrome b/b6 domain-containing protein [Palleronia rufa]
MLREHYLGSGRDSARSGKTIQVWDPLVRLIHWGVVLMVVINAAIVAKDSQLHLWAGYTMLVLVGVRLLWGVIGTRPARFAAFPPNPFRALDYVKKMRRSDKTVHLSHNPLGALMVYNIWTTLLLIATTGYMMGTIRFFGVVWVERAHELAYDWLLVSIAAHILGVAFDIWRSGVPLVQAMIHGAKRIPNDTPVE